MKESEAEKLVCPFISTYFPSSIGNKERGFKKCISSQCIAWEAEAEYKEKKGTTDLIKEKSADSGNCKMMQQNKVY